MSQPVADIAYQLQLLLSCDYNSRISFEDILTAEENAMKKKVLKVGTPVIINQGDFGDSYAVKIGKIIPCIIVEKNPFKSYYTVEYIRLKDSIAIKATKEIYESYCNEHIVINK
jgi:hypothetical protein